MTTKPGADPLSVRRRFASYLSGQGVEIGPGHVPFPVPDAVAVRYVDRWEPDELRSLFPELGDDPGFPKADIQADLDQDRLSALVDGGQDFVIASHVLEHLANPLAMLVDIYRVLRPEGLLILLLPDRHSTFDRQRAATPLSHIMDELERDVRAVDDEHIVDFLVGVRATMGDVPDITALTVEARAREIAIYRRRSVHVHVWDPDEFSAVLDYAADNLDLRWEILDWMVPGAEGTWGDEFGWVLKRPLGPDATPGRMRRNVLRAIRKVSHLLGGISRKLRTVRS
jgi:SAM-dependent methyltransferase